MLWSFFVYFVLTTTRNFVVFRFCTKLQWLLLKKFRPRLSCSIHSRRKCESIIKLPLRNVALSQCLHALYVKENRTNAKFTRNIGADRVLSMNFSKGRTCAYCLSKLIVAIVWPHRVLSRVSPEESGVDVKCFKFRLNCRTAQRAWVKAWCVASGRGVIVACLKPQKPIIFYETAYIAFRGWTRAKARICEPAVLRGRWL